MPCQTELALLGWYGPVAVPQVPGEGRVPLAAGQGRGGDAVGGQLTMLLEGLDWSRVTPLIIKTPLRAC